MTEYQKVTQPDELSDGDRKPFILDDIPALLLRLDGNFYCIEDVCTHDGQPLTDGALEDCSIICPRHGAKFDLRNGAVLCMPATEPVQTFNVEVRDDGVYVEIPE